MPTAEPETRQQELERLERIEALRREIDEEAGLPPEEVEARAAERHRRDLEARGLVEVDRQAQAEKGRRRGMPGVLAVVVALAIVAGVGGLAFAGLLPGLGGRPAAATPGAAVAQPTPAVPATATSAPAPKPTGAAATSAPAKPTAAPATPTTELAQAKPAVKPTARPAVPTPAPAQPTPVPTAPPAAQPTSAPAVQPTQPPAKPTEPPAPLPTTVTLKDGVEMRLVPGGSFVMGDDGDPSAAPKFTLSLPDFYVDRDEVTNARFAAFVQQAGYKAQGDWQHDADPANFDARFFETDRTAHPVVNVTWNDATAYCQWAGKRLPTEAEWEKAARGEDGRRWPWGSEPHPEFANVEDNSDAEPDTMKIGSFPQGASPYGLLDMTGNAREWTASALQSYPLTDPMAGPQGATSRVTRGGSWLSLPNSIEVSRRLAEPVGTAAKDLGFRCAVSAEQATRR